MPSELANDHERYDDLRTIALHVLEQFALLNRTLAEIEERLRGIEQRMSYATVLDSSD